MFLGGVYSNNRRRGIQYIVPRSKSIDWVSGGGGQNCGDRHIGQNYRARGGYRTIGCYTSWNYTNYSRGDRCLEGCEILSFHFLSFYKDFGDEIQIIEGVGWVHGLDEQSIWIGIDHGTLLFEFWILVFFGTMMMWLGIAQKGEFWEEGRGFLDT
jgi:hypothetical protein